MLSATTSPHFEIEADAATRVVHIDITDTTLRLALSFVAEDAGWRRGAAAAGALTVSNQLFGATAESPVHVFVVEPRSADCRTAVEAVAAGRAVAVLCADEPEQLPVALDAARTRFALIPERVIAAANAGPALDDRLRETLNLVASGNSNASIARALHESESTAKRDVATLMRLFGVRSRGALTDIAARAGYYRPWAATAVT
jgi:DNA-binding NarL/FixJ family response regulator